MKKIILASASPHRKKLFRLLGVQFTVKPSRARELTRITTTCADLVKGNALLKAKDIAGKIKDGIVIGADTLVYLGGKKIVGKPRNLAQAKRTLKALSRKPQWVYTGLAIIDAKTQKALIGCEKTKLWMYPIDDKEIDRYYRYISPMDKAGGFDVQGKGSLLIRRLEGCYFNVVGLPIAKLARMLKKFGISILMLTMISMLVGCVTEYNLATQQQETLLFGTEKEIKLGEGVVAAFEKEAKIITDIDINERVSNILKKIVDVCDRKELIYTIKIVDDDLVNAVSLPGGFIYVYKGLIDKIKSDDELACVIAHEVGHVTAKHSVKKLQSLYGYNFLKILSAQTTKSADFTQGVDLAFASVFLAYSREDEFLADKLGIKYAKKAGYNPEGMAGFLKKLSELQEKESAKQFSYWRTHPFISQRVAAANQEVSGSLEFKDYLNLIGEDR